MEKPRPAVEEEIKVEDGSVAGGSGSSNTQGTEDGGTESPKKPKQLQHVIIDLIPKTEGHSELRLQTLLEEPNSHKFYCPNCRACIQNIEVIPTDPFECTYCYSFLQIIGCGLVSICKPGPERPKPGPPSPGPSQDIPPKKWDILKSIVYGGLIESITSLNIVTSAAGADATTLHILALALASLIGGLFVIGHNIIELRQDIQQPERTSTTTSTGETNNEEQTSRYYQQLGLIENFKRHAAVTVISFLLFGMVAPVTYSFSFLKSDDKDLKLIAVAAASLVCIAMLAIAKAYIQKASSFYGYVKTVLFFVIPGFLASGLSYVVGDLVKKLMEKLGLFDSSSDFTLSLPGTGRIEPRWEFY